MEQFHVRKDAYSDCYPYYYYCLNLFFFFYTGHLHFNFEKKVINCIFSQIEVNFWNILKCQTSGAQTKKQKNEFESKIDS